LLEEKYGRAEAEKFIKEFNTAGTLEALTEKQGKRLIGRKTDRLDTIRDRILTSAWENDISEATWKVQTSVLKQEATDDTETDTGRRNRRQRTEPLSEADFQAKKAELEEADFYSDYSKKSKDRETGRRAVSTSPVPSGRGAVPSDRVILNLVLYFEH